MCIPVGAAACAAAIQKVNEDIQDHDLSGAEGTCFRSYVITNQAVPVVC
ncbi:hypothetical protein ACH61_01912 [Rathayibacter tanaceti]|uniref:Uncharacterized protein n=1 Tax=Rathayibacter tanaceti TaxID=1671680 RepID=A0A166HPP8_9MICO|nr:hypothetical protein ACH61_01912 [Rathayibacter tanaceti]